MDGWIYRAGALTLKTTKNATAYLIEPSPKKVTILNETGKMDKFTEFFVEIK